MMMLSRYNPSAPFSCFLKHTATEAALKVEGLVVRQWNQGSCQQVSQMRALCTVRFLHAAAAAATEGPRLGTG